MSDGNGSTSGNHRATPCPTAEAGDSGPKIAKHSTNGTARALFEGARNRLLEFGSKFFG